MWRSEEFVADTQLDSLRTVTLRLRLRAISINQVLVRQRLESDVVDEELGKHVSMAREWYV